ncbi:terminase small subunit [Caudoviricetes sp.]|nr:terminase small subunit [Caudoviricetes sp.]
MTDKKTKTKPTTGLVVRNEEVTQESLSNELATIAKEVAAPKNKGGRPSKYSPELVDTICERLALGEGLAQICRDEDMPSQTIVYQWLNRHPEFLERYTRAREEQAETHADEIVAIADETPETVPVYDKEGNLLRIDISSAYVAWQKQRIDARKWNAAKQRPKKYGDRVTHGGDDDAPVVVEHNLNVFGELLKAIKTQRQLEE